ncbi:hypothetical protein Cgig2_033763 [Carnegiea gigantea]|uniref:Uncharacterized protein n=1 Tax=Carnegiea gigantea TaxID=171969 RepID=A0A9Q1KJK5_9CARY|nr:hypothetical protein Cgig2_033763 [Carnegiea gigantea]
MHSDNQVRALRTRRESRKDMKSQERCVFIEHNTDGPYGNFTRFSEPMAIIAETWGFPCGSILAEELGILPRVKADVIEEALQDLKKYSFEGWDALYEDVPGTLSALLTHIKGRSRKKGSSLLAFDSISLFKKRGCASAPRLPLPLPEDYRQLFPDFDRRDTEKATQVFGITKIIQSAFYAMVVNDTLELSMVMRNIALVLKSTLLDLYWYTFEA